jgi:aspartate/methionine/tyrosine aminotransferase
MHPHRSWFAVDEYGLRSTRTFGERPCNGIRAFDTSLQTIILPVRRAASGVLPTIAAMSSIAVTPENREKCYNRTRAQLSANVAIVNEWVQTCNGLLTWHKPQAGAIALMKYSAEIPSVELAERIRTRQNTLVVPGTYLDIEGYLRVWLGGREEYLREGLRRVREELLHLRNEQTVSV